MYSRKTITRFTPFEQDDKPKDKRRTKVFPFHLPPFSKFRDRAGIAARMLTPPRTFNVSPYEDRRVNT